MGRVSTEGVMQCFVDHWAWPSQTIFKTTIKMVHSEGCFNLFPGI